MNNAKKLYIAKEAGVLKKLLGSRGIKQTVNQVNTPWSQGISHLHGAKGLKGLSRMNIQQYKNPPHKMPAPNNPYDELAEALGERQSPYMKPKYDLYGKPYAGTLDHAKEMTPLGNLIKTLGLTAPAGAGLGYAAYKGLEADDELGEPYNYRGNPNE